MYSVYVCACGLQETNDDWDASGDDSVAAGAAADDDFGSGNDNFDNDVHLRPRPGEDQEHEGSAGE